MVLPFMDVKSERTHSFLASLRLRNRHKEKTMLEPPCDIACIFFLPLLCQIPAARNRKLCSVFLRDTLELHTPYTSFPLDQPIGTKVYG